MRIDATGLHYRELNETIKAAIAQGESEFDLTNVVGHRYIGCGVSAPVTIRIEGIPGNDLAAFMDGPSIYCTGNGQDGIGNTMNGGLVVIPGHAGDVMGYSMRGGRIYIRGNAGYRIGINMKSYQGREPEVIIGGRARDFCGEYLAGGKLVVLGLDLAPGEPIVGRYCATGMHGGRMYIRGEVAPDRVRKGVSVDEADDEDKETLREVLAPYCEQFGLSLDEIMAQPFTRIVSQTTRPYGQLYAY